MTTRWDSSYQTITRVSPGTKTLRVEFANTDHAEITYEVLGLTEYKEIHWQQARVEADGLYIFVPASPRDLEIPWDVVRRLTDEEFARHLSEASERQAHHVGAGLRQLRLDWDMSQSKVASLAGIEQATLSRIETGRSDVSASMVFRILGALGATLSALADCFSGQPWNERDSGSKSSSDEEIGDLRRFACDLNDATRLRRTLRVKSILHSNDSLLNSLALQEDERPSLFCRLAQWVDGDPTLLGRLESLLADVTKTDFAQIRISEAIVALCRERYSDALYHLNVVFAATREIANTEVLALAHHTRARCLERQGRYKDALDHAEEALAISAGIATRETAAHYQVLKAWLLFVTGRTVEALANFKEAERVLTSADDAHNLGNILSAYGRIARMDGDYCKAIEYFQLAIDEYRRYAPTHVYLGRVLCNMAFTKRLFALHEEARQQQDQASASFDVAGSNVTVDGDVTVGMSGALRQAALSHLAEASRIFTLRRWQRGLGMVAINRGYLSLDGKDFETASREAENAYELGSSIADVVLMARARIFSCKVEAAKSPSDHFSNPEGQLPAAAFAEQALVLAKQTQDSRLIARARIWRGISLAREGLLLEAKEHCNEAMELLKPLAKDYVWAELRLLRSRIDQAGIRDLSLIEWLNGEIGDKSFSEISDELFDILAHKLCERENSDPCSVAQRLEVSEHRVRCALQRSRQGVLAKYLNTEKRSEMTNLDNR